MKEIVRGTGVAFIMKIVAAGAAFTFNIVLARFLGANDLGLFYLALTCCSIAMILGQFGLGQVLIRYVATHSSGKDWPAVKSVVTESLRIACLFSFLTAAIMVGTASWISEFVFHEIQLAPLLCWMSLAIIPGTLFVLYGFSLQGLCKIKESILVSGILMPTISIAATAILVPLVGINGCVWGYVFASLCTLLTAYILWKKALPSFNGEPYSFPIKKLFISCFPLFIISVSQLFIAWSSNITLGIYGSTSDVGIFSIANRTAMLVGFILTSVNTMSAPKFASIYSNGDIKKLESIAVKTTSLMLLLALPILLSLIIFPKQVLAIFGESFTEGSTLLVILAIGQFINVTTGSVGYLLSMSGREKIMRKVMVFSAILIVILNIILIPLLGVLGAALATAITLSAQNILAAFAVWKHMGIITIPYISILMKKQHHR